MFMVLSDIYITFVGQEIQSESQPNRTMAIINGKFIRKKMFFTHFFNKQFNVRQLKKNK